MRKREKKEFLFVLIVDRTGRGNEQNIKIVPTRQGSCCSVPTRRPLEERQANSFGISWRLTAGTERGAGKTDTYYTGRAM